MIDLAARGASTHTHTGAKGKGKELRIVKRGNTHMHKHGRLLVVGVGEVTIGLALERLLDLGQARLLLHARRKIVGAQCDLGGVMFSFRNSMTCS